MSNSLWVWFFALIAHRRRHSAALLFGLATTQRLEVSARDLVTRLRSRSDLLLFWGQLFVLHHEYPIALAVRLRFALFFLLFGKPACMSL